MGLETILITFIAAVFVAIISVFIAVCVSSLEPYPPYQDKPKMIDPNWPYPNWPFPTDKKP